LSKIKANWLLFLLDWFRNKSTASRI